MLTHDEKQELLRIARTEIVRCVRGTGPERQRAVGGELSKPRGAFVTLRINEQLRGCIGYIESALPLAEVVAEVAVKSATEDPRFPPVSPGELDQVTIEISILSPLKRIASPSEIEIGVHGLLLEVGHRRGLLLPQVATEYGWGREEFLENTARKAGLPRDAWMHPSAEIFAFSAEIVKEDEVPA